MLAAARQTGVDTESIEREKERLKGRGWCGVLALCLIAISVSFASLLTLCA